MTPRRAPTDRAARRRPRAEEGVLGRLLRAAAALLVAAVTGCRCAPETVGYLDPPDDGVPVKCPVSGKTCTKTPDTPAAIFDGRTYYFCCPDCPKRFAEDPARYVRR